MPFPAILNIVTDPHSSSKSSSLLEVAGLWPHLCGMCQCRMCQCRMCPHQLAILVYIRSSERTRKLRKRCSTAVCLFLFPFCSFHPFSFLSLLYFFLKSFFHLTQHRQSAIQIRHLGSPMCSVRTWQGRVQSLCLHFSHTTPLRKSLTINHFLCIQYFQQILHAGKSRKHIEQP